MNIENLVGQFAISTDSKEWYASRVVFVFSVTPTEIHVFHPFGQSDIHFFTPQEEIDFLVNMGEIKIKILKRNPQTDEQWMPYEEFLIRNDDILETEEARKFKELEGKLGIHEGSAKRINHNYEHDFHYVHKVTNTHALLVSRFDIARSELGFGYKIHFTTEELHRIETLILQGKLKVHIVQHQLIDGDWIDFSKLISLKYFEVKKEESKKLKSLVGHWIIRTQETKSMFGEFRDHPVFLLSVTDGHMVFFDGDENFSPLEHRDSELFQLVEEGKISIQYASRSFIDEHWVKFEDIFRKKQVLTDSKAIALSKHIGTYIQNDVDSKHHPFGNEKLYLFNVTDSHMIVYNPKRNKYFEQQAGLSVDPNDLRSLEIGVAAGILIVDILTKEYFEENWISDFSNSSI